MYVPNKLERYTTLQQKGLSVTNTRLLVSLVNYEENEVL